MAKTATKASGAGSRKAADTTSTKKPKKPTSPPRTAVAVQAQPEPEAERQEDEHNKTVEMLLKLLQSPIVADLLAVAATAALAALAEHGFNSRGGAPEGKRAGKAVKAAGKAAAAAVGRRLATEIDEIKKAAKPKDSAEA